MSEPFSIVTGELYERAEDMSPDGRLQVLIQADGDAIITAVSRDAAGKFSMTSVEFCAPGGGGGRSPRTRAALVELARAICEDNGGAPSLL